MKLNTYMKHGIAIASFFVITLLFWGPLFSGNVLVQGDIQQYNGMASEITEYRGKGEKIHWTNSAYGGMPTYLLGQYLYNDSNLTGTVNSSIRKLLPGVSAIFLIGLICFYILMRCLKINHWLAIAGSFLFIASSFSIQSFVAGHNSKMNAFAYAPLIVAGLIYLFKNRPWLGLFCLSFGLAAQISVNHLQITFYTFFICFIYFITEVIRGFQKGRPNWWKPIALSFIGVVIALGVNYNRLYSIYQYADFSTRSGKSAIQNNNATKSKDQAYDYTTEWSYKPIESLTLLIPNFMGGASNENMGKKSSWYGNQQIPRSLQTNPPTYWGQVPFTGGPVYIGAVLFALFCFGILFIKKRWKWWVIIASALMILLAWGKFSPVYNLFYHGFPFFDKFRTPMMALLMLSLLFPIIALKGIDKAVLSNKNKLTLNKILIGFGIPVGILLLFGFLGPNLYSFEGAIDGQLRDSGFPRELMDSLVDDRKSLLFNDSLRSLLFVVLTAACFWLYMKKILKRPLLIGAIILLIFVDLFTINKRYLSEDNFTDKSFYENSLRGNSVNKEIQKDKSHYRVYELVGNPFANATTSYHHKSLGGYHAAKLQSYDDLISSKITTNDFNVLNMLNAKYFIGQNNAGELGYEENNEANGNAWFAKKIKTASDNQSALTMLDGADLKNEVIVEKSDDMVIDIGKSDSLNSDNIRLISYHPEKMVYQSESNQNGFGVFSEIYYQQKDGDGWVASIDGESVPVLKTNFLLRGIQIPAGTHEIVFEYRKSAFQKRATISKIFSGILLLFGIGFLWNVFLKRRG